MAQRIIAALLAAALAAPPAHAQTGSARNMTIIRDTEIEQLMRDYTRPVLKAAGIKPRDVKVVLIGDRSFNAFIADGRHIYINTGSLIDAQTPNEVIGVLAHEAGHIAGGHLARLHQQLAASQIMAVAGMLLGVGAAAGAASLGSNKVGNAGAGAAGIAAGSQEMVRRSMLAYQRSEEQAADRAAVRYLEQTGQSPAGLLATFRRFNNEQIFKTSSIDPYLQSHPLPQDRIAQLETLVSQSKTRDAKDPEALVARHEMVRAKLIGFTERPETVMRKYPISDSSAPARYARAVAAYRSGRLADAIGNVDALLKQQPANAYLWELKGQILLESGRVREAIPALRKASALAPQSSLIAGMLGRALTTADDPKLNAEAMRVLLRAAQSESDSADIYQDLAILYARRGDIGMAELNSAQSYFNQGKWSEAATQASRAMSRLPTGSPGWLRAEDIMNYQFPRPRT